MGVPLRSLSNILWRERQLVDLVERGARDRFDFQLIELERAMVVDDIVRALDLDDDVTLLDLAAQLPTPWPDVLELLHASLASADVNAMPRSLAEFLG